MALQAALAFEQIAIRWAQDPRVADAYVAGAKLLTEESLPNQAVDLCVRGAARLHSHDPGQLRLAAIKGTALARLGKNDEAAVAFAAALQPGFESLDQFSQLAILNRAAYFAVGTKQYRQAASYLSRAAGLAPNDMQRIGYLLRAVEADENASDLETAQNDLRRLDDAARHVLQETATAEDTLALKILLAEIERHHKKSKS